MAEQPEARPWRAAGHGLAGLELHSQKGPGGWGFRVLKFYSRMGGGFRV